jgi:diguanylate cyclase (GGDEF)-like protein
LSAPANNIISKIKIYKTLLLGAISTNINKDYWVDIMELKTYLNILLKKWWIVLSIFLVTLTAGIVFTYTQTPVYNATATYVVVPSKGFDTASAFANGLDMLSRRNEIATTLTEIASSNKIKQLAVSSLSLESGQGYSINSDLREGSNVIEITVNGPNPAIAQDLANAVGRKTIEYVGGVFEVYTISPLDEAKLPTSPISPQKTRDISLAIVAGLILGGAIAFLSQYLEPSSESIVNVNIIDEETGAYNKHYFLSRLGEEMVRAKRNRYPLSVALMRIDNLNMLRGVNVLKVRHEALRYVAVLMKQYLREEDLVAYVDQDTFAFLLLDTPSSNAQAIMEYMQTRVALAPFQSKFIDTKLNLSGTVGIAAYNHNGTGRDQLIDMAVQALELAEVSQNGKVYLSTEADLEKQL